MYLYLSMILLKEFLKAKVDKITNIIKKLAKQSKVIIALSC